MNLQTSIEMTPLLSQPASVATRPPETARMSLAEAIEAIKRKKINLNEFKTVFSSHSNPREEIKNQNFLFVVVSGDKWKTFDILRVLLPVVDSDILSSKDENGKTVLHVAIENEHDRCTDAIIRKNNDYLAIGDNEGNTPLHYMVRLERTKACRKAMEFCSADVINQKNKNSLSAVHFAARERSPDIMKMLLDNGGDPKALTDRRYTALHFAAQSGSSQCVKYLLEKMSDREDRIKYLNEQTDMGLTALMLAAKPGFIAVCKELLETDISLKSNDGNTALHHAAIKGSLHLVKILMTGYETQSDSFDKDKAKLISFENRDFISSCLTAAINGKNDNCFAYFLEKAKVQLTDTDVKNLVDLAAATSLKCVKQMVSRPEFEKYLIAYRTEGGDNLLHLAITMKSFVTAKELLKKTKIDKFIKNKNKDSALHLVARQPPGTFLNCHEEEKQCVTRELLLDSRELVKSANIAGETPLHLAARSGNTDLVRSILHKEPNILSVTKKKMTAIHYAAENGHTYCLEMLLRSLKAQDYHKFREIKPHPLHLSASNGHMECCELLLTASLVGDNPEENLVLKAQNGQYPVDRAFRGKHAEVFGFLLSKMKFNEDVEFFVRLHRYFKKCLTVVSGMLDPSSCSFYISATEAMIESSWCRVVLDGRYCSPNPEHPSHCSNPQPKSSVSQPLLDSKTDESDKTKRKPCESFALLVKTHTSLACKAMDKHISVPPNAAYEVHDYTLFEYIYFCTEGEKLVSPFEEEAAQTSPPITTNVSQQSCSAVAPSPANQRPSSSAQTVGGAAGANSPSCRTRNRIAPSHSAANPTSSNASNFVTANTTNPGSHSVRNLVNPNTSNPTASLTAARSNAVNLPQNVPHLEIFSGRPLKAHAQEFKGTSWCEDHPLQEAVRGGHTQVLRHKLVKSWLMKKWQYARYVLWSYLALDLLTAVFVFGLQALLWTSNRGVPTSVPPLQRASGNTRHLEAQFSGVTRDQVTTVYGSDLSYNTTVQTLVEDVRYISANDSQCANWGTGECATWGTGECTTWGTEDSLNQELLNIGSASWNKSVCALFYLEQKWHFVVSLEVGILILILVHGFIEFMVFHSTSLSVWDVHRVSRLVLRLPFMAMLLFGLSLCDFKLGCREIMIWQFEVVAVLLSWIHVVLTLNKVPRFSGFMPVTPMLLLRYVLAVVPLFLFLWAFALTFHLLFMDLLPFETVPYSLIKTVTWLLGDLGYDDTFRNVAGKLKADIKDILVNPFGPDGISGSRSHFSPIKMQSNTCVCANAGKAVQATV
ncbi:Ankyrin repeat-containing domain [Trinorchestia longiramus]|nr:Ankyrin repeat-containing domain [Trinorchestia longiramus]